MTSPAQPDRTLLLVGNPNVGKSVLFSKLTGKYVVISNYPGTTVEITSGQMHVNGQNFTVIDTPGVNELVAHTDDARVTCNVLREHPQATVLQVADAKNLRRALLLTHELARMKRRVVLVLNMMDELDACGGKIDVRKLSELLGIPVVPTIAIANTGIHLLQKSIPEAAVPRMDAAMCGAGSQPTFFDGTSTEQDVLPAINELLAQTYSHVRPRRATVAQKIGWWATHPLKGLAFLALALYATFWFVGLLGAGSLVNLLESGLFGRYINPGAIRTVDALVQFPHQHSTEISELRLEFPLTPTHGIELWSNQSEVLSAHYTPTTTGWRAFVHDFLVGPYGVITMALSYGFAIVLPIVTTFFLLFGVLEDSGYLPRLAVMVHRLFRAMGLNGKAVLPMILGLGCDTMATMATRILQTRKERLITTLLLALAVPCSAQLGVLLAMVTRVSTAATVFWLTLIIGVLFAIGWLAARLYGGATSDFILELPPMRRPLLSNVALKTAARLEWYLKEVIPLFVIGTILLFALDRIGLLDKLVRVAEPLVQHWLGLPARTAEAFLVGFLRRDFGAVYLLDAATGPNPELSPHQVLVAMVTITLFMPCVATLFMISRELGTKTAAWIACFVFGFAFLAGGIVHRVAGWLGL